jgi:hypothetical protein
MRLVVQDDDVRQRQQLTAGAAQHLALCLQRLDLRPSGTLQQALAYSVGLQHAAAL